MKVAFIARSTLYSAPGGDTVQVMEIAKHVKEHGVCAEINLVDDIIDYNEYSLLHFFNITRPADILYHLSKTKKPFVVSPIFIDYSQYDKYHRQGITGILFRFLSRDYIEWLKTTARFIKGNDRRMYLSYFFKGQRRGITEILNKTKMLLPNSEAEYRSIAQSYNSASRYHVVPNGINDEIFSGDKNAKKDPLMVLCVARIEGIKNQINLIKALNGTIYKLFIIGKPAPNQGLYYKRCREIAESNICFIDHIPQSELIQYYREAKVHILPSWFETTGLSSLEAAAMGCNVVITDKGFAGEYFGQDAMYCDPGSPKSIYAAVEQASKKETNNILQNKIFANFTWQHAALQTVKTYAEIINE